MRINSFFVNVLLHPPTKTKHAELLNLKYFLPSLRKAYRASFIYYLVIEVCMWYEEGLCNTQVFFILEMNNHNFASLYQFLGERQNGVIDCLKLWFSTKLVKVLLSHNDFWNVRAQILLSSCLRVALYRSLESQRSVILLRSTRPLWVPCTWLQRFLGGLKSIEIGQNWQSYCAIDT